MQVKTMICAVYLLIFSFIECLLFLNQNQIAKPHSTLGLALAKLLVLLIPCFESFIPVILLHVKLFVIYSYWPVRNIPLAFELSIEMRSGNMLFWPLGWGVRARLVYWPLSKAGWNVPSYIPDHPVWSKRDWPRWSIPFIISAYAGFCLHPEKPQRRKLLCRVHTGPWAEAKTSQRGRNPIYETKKALGASLYGGTPR